MEITTYPPVDIGLAKYSCRGDVSSMVKFYERKRESYFTNLELLIMLSWLPLEYIPDLVSRLTDSFSPFLVYLKRYETYSKVRAHKKILEGVAIGLPA